MQMQNSEHKTGKAEHICLILLFVIYVSLTLFSLSRIIIWEDEYYILFFQRVSGGAFSHTDITAYLHYLVYSFFGLSLLTERIVPFIFSLASFFIFLKFLDENYSRKVKFIALGIFCLVPWHVFFSTTVYVNNEASLTFLLLSALFIARYTKNQKSFPLFLAGAFLGLSFSVYESLAIYTLPMALFVLITGKREIKKILRELIILGSGFLLVALAYFVSHIILFGMQSLYIIWAWGLMDKAKYYRFDARYLQYFAFTLVRIFLYAGPLIMIGLLGSLLRKKTHELKRENLNLLFLGMIVTAFVFYCIVVPPGNHQVRYIAPVIPYLAIFTAKYIASLPLTSRDLKVIALMTALVFVFTYAVNSQGVLVNIRDYAKLPLNQLLSSYFISVHPGDSGTTVMIALILFSVVFSSALFLVLRLTGESTNKLAAIILISFCAGFSLFTLQEYLFHSSGVNFDATYKILNDYLKSVPGKVIYTNLNVHFITEAYNISNEVSYRDLINFTLNTRLSPGGREEYLVTRPKDAERFNKVKFIDTSTINDMDDEEAGLLFGKLRSQNATVIMINNHNYYGYNTNLYKRLNSYCHEVLVLKDKGYLCGMVYQCQEQ